MSPLRRALHGIRLARLEGLAGIRDRLLDRWVDALRRLSCALPVRRREAARGAVLHLLATPPVPWLGGVQVQLRERMRVAAQGQPFALLHSDRHGWRLQVEHGGRCHALRLAGGAARISPMAVETGLLAAADDAIERLAPTLLHVENAAGFALSELVELAAQRLPLVLSVHDFSLFCIRPHLLEQGAQTFCGYSRDADRCGRCLAADGSHQGFALARHRELAGVLLERSAKVVFASPFLRDQHRRLFPDVDLADAEVVPPSAPLRPLLAPRSTGAATGPRRIAIVGGAAVHKGSRILDSVLSGMSRDERRAWRLTLFGGGDLGELQRLRRHRHLRVRGYYRAGALPALLRRHRCELALLLSVVPESHGLALDECRVAGVPVVAFDLGAVAERMRALGGGWLVPPEQGAAGVLGALRAISRDDQQQAAAALAPQAAPAPVPAPAPAAAYARIYSGAAASHSRVAPFHDPR